MDASKSTSGLAVVVVACVVLASGPLAGGLVRPSEGPTTLGEGNVTVEDVTVPTGDLVVSQGRFGTAVPYLRVPDAGVRLADVSGEPRLLYRVSVPALDAEVTATRIVTGAGGYRLSHRDLGFPPDEVTGEHYAGMVTVRVQSFTVDRTVFESNVTVEVRE